MTGVAVTTAVSARIWREYLIAFCPNLNPSTRGVVTTVDGCELVTLGTLVLTFDINADSFPAKAHVIEDLGFDVLIGRHFLREFCSRIDFVGNVVEFVRADDPLPFDLSRLSDVPDVDDSEFVSSLHYDISFAIPPRSEKIVLGKLKNILVNEDVCGIVIPRSDLPHRYSFLALQKLSKFQRMARFRSEWSIHLHGQLKCSAKLGWVIFLASGMKLRHLSCVNSGPQ